MKFDYKLVVFEGIETRYQTKIYSDITQKIFNEKEIPQKNYQVALDWFFNQDQIVPTKEKRSVKEINVYPEMRIFIIFSEKHQVMFKNLTYLAENTGWYFYITGPKLEKDEITEYIESLKISDKIFTINWELSDDIEVFLDPIATDLNKNAYLLKLVDQKANKTNFILLDAGLDEEDINNLKLKTNNLDLIFISHAHRDHTSGLFLLNKSYPNAPIICSRTTFEFYLLYNNHKNFSENRIRAPIGHNLHENLYFIKNEDIIQISNGCFLKFFHAGHMPGALMLLFKISKFIFLFTGDFSFYDYFPIAGVGSIVENISQNIDFLLVDGTFSSSEFDAPSYLFNNLEIALKAKARYRNKVLIGADYGSTAMVLFFTIFRFFRKMQRVSGFDAIRPRIYLSTRIRRFFQIMTYNKEDLHPYFKNLILKEHNPFQSAIIKWINSYRDLEEGLSETGGIFILEPADLRYGWIQNAFRIISQNKHNLIYLSGALRNPAAIELTSGNDNIELKNFKTGAIYQITNKAQIWNRKYPNLVLNLHADKFQLEKLLDKLKPSHVCFFQQDPRKLVKVRNYLRNRFEGISTSAIYRYPKHEILLHSDSRRFNIKIKS